MFSGESFSTEKISPAIEHVSISKMFAHAYKQNEIPGTLLLLHWHLPLVTLPQILEGQDKVCANDE